MPEAAGAGHEATAPLPTRAFIGIGSNLADPRAQIERALGAIARVPQTRLLAQSSLYRTAAHGVQARQPDYLNAVALVATRLRPEDLLRALQEIERRQRRRRSTVHGARSIDLDLLLYGALRRRTARLALPHPRLHERAFVLEPLLELAPDVRIPRLGVARKFLRRARRQRVTRLGPLPP